MEGFDGQEVCVVNDGNDECALGVEVAGLGDEAGLAFVVVAGGFELHGGAEQAQEVVPGVQGAVDDGRDPLFGIVAGDGVFEDGLAGAGFAKDEAEAALAVVDLEDVEVALLVLHEGGVLIKGEGVAGEAEVGADHDGCQLLVIGYQLSVISYQLSVISYQLSVIGLESDVGAAVVGDGVEKGGVAKADAVLIDGGGKAGVAVVADGDGFVAHVAGGFVAAGVEAEGVVDADFAGVLKHEEFGGIRVAGEIADAVQIKAEAVDGFHAEGGVDAVVIGGFEPFNEGGVEVAQGVDVGEVAGEELVAHGAEEAFDLAFGGRRARGCG